MNDGDKCKGQDSRPVQKSSAQKAKDERIDAPFQITDPTGTKSKDKSHRAKPDFQITAEQKDPFRPDTKTGVSPIFQAATKGENKNPTFRPGPREWKQSGRVSLF
ncbi:MAG: hypothetical protein V6Z82_04500 [Flavobacteriales bacterium]